MTGVPRITEIHIQGLRTLADVRLKLDGLTVLIGENGSGKSSIIEACELLRRAGGSEFMSEFYNPHGGVFSLFRQGTSRLCLGVSLDWGGQSWSYSVALAKEGYGARIEEESLRANNPPRQMFCRQGERAEASFSHGEIEVGRSFTVRTSKLLLGEFGVDAPNFVQNIRAALQAIDVHLPFEVLPSWAARAYSRKSEIRSSVLLQPAERVDLIGTNLANAFHMLRNANGDEHWRTTMDYIRLGLGDWVESVVNPPDPGGGAINLALKARNRETPIPAMSLSDGQLAYLGFVALFRLKRERSLLAIDEPELHLHPHLLFRVVKMLEAMGETHPVLVSTHSDRLLDALTEPKCVHVCELDQQASATALLELDPVALAEWLADYRGLGELRSHGHLGSVLKAEPQG